MARYYTFSAFDMKKSDKEYPEFMKVFGMKFIMFYSTITPKECAVVETKDWCKDNDGNVTVLVKLIYCSKNYTRTVMFAAKEEIKAKQISTKEANIYAMLELGDANG